MTIDAVAVITDYRHVREDSVDQLEVRYEATRSERRVAGVVRMSLAASEQAVATAVAEDAKVTLANARHGQTITVGAVRVFSGPSVVV